MNLKVKENFDVYFGLAIITMIYCWHVITLLVYGEDKIFSNLLVISMLIYVVYLFYWQRKIENES